MDSADKEPAAVPVSAAGHASPQHEGPGLDGHAVQVDRLTHPIFVYSYLANLILVTANAAMFVFADWVAWLATQSNSDIAYVEELPGRIVREGLIAAICARLFLGMSIDHFGVRRVWVFMSLLMLCGAGIFASMHHLTTLVYVGRMCFVVGLAGMFTCGTFHIQNCVAEHRRTEFIALLGSSGFLGMIFGSQLAAFLKWRSQENDEWYFAAIFLLLIVLLVIYVVLMLICTQGAVKRVSAVTRPSLLRLTWKYWPGSVVVVAMTMGLVFTVPSLYLIRFNRYAGMEGIATFWTTYAVLAFTFRLRTASLSRRVGRYRLITFGLLAQGLGLWALIPATESWHLLISASICGLGHALLFPSIVSLGSGTFPPEYRGSGTNLTLGCFDLGGAISAPLLGRIIDLPRFDGVGFRQMFFVAGLIPLVMATIWFFTHHTATDAETESHRLRQNGM